MVALLNSSLRLQVRKRLTNCFAGWSQALGLDIAGIVQLYEASGLQLCWPRLSSVQLSADAHANPVDVSPVVHL